MHKIVIKNLVKEYKINDKENFCALKNINLTFGDRGLVGIIGKSGSGKSTLLNMIGAIDYPTCGEVLIDGINYIKKRNKSKFYKTKIGFLFQQYNLIDEYSSAFNCALPLMINGKNKKAAFKKAFEVLEKVGINKEKAEMQSAKLSGGEKQRVALARSIINNPDIILCDEPTGALDSSNSISLMETLKKISENTLVIIVSHNLHLMRKYTDRIISIKEGKIDYDITKNHFEKQIIKGKKKTKINSNWIDIITFKNLKKHFKRNLFSIFGLIVGSLSFLLTVGFINGKEVNMSKVPNNLYDYGVGTISIEEKISSGSLLSLTKSTRPNLEEVLSRENIKEKYNICLNFDAILPQNLNIYYENELCEDLVFSPIYEFSSSQKNNKLIIKGRCPKENVFNEVVINQFTYNYLKEKIKKDPLNETITCSQLIQYIYIDDEYNSINEIYNFDEQFKIVGVCDEFSYLLTNKVYYSHSLLEEKLDTIILPTLSTYFNKTITWRSLVKEADNSSPLSAYSLKLFPKNNTLINQEDILEGYSFYSSSILIKDSLKSFLDVTEYGCGLFLIITTIGIMLIVGIISFTNYSEDHKKSAILSCLGARHSDICFVYSFESLINSLIAVIISFPLTIVITKLANNLISSFIDFKSLIVIPFEKLYNINFLLPISLILIMAILSILFSSIPILFSKKIDLKTELKSL